MKYTVTHTCGHAATHDIYGPNTQGQREYKAGRLAEGPCPDCRAAARAERHDQQVATALDTAQTAMPALTGTPRQVSWAETLRERALARLVDDPAAVRHAATLTDATWWIDHRNALPQALTEGATQHAAESDSHSPAQTETVLPADAPAPPTKEELLAMLPLVESPRPTPEELAERDAHAERSQKQREIFDAAPELRGARDVEVARMLAVALRQLLDARAAGSDRVAEITGMVEALRRVVLEVQRIPIGVVGAAWAPPARSPETAQWADLTPEEQDAAQYHWLRRELDAYASYWSQTDPAHRVRRAWMEWRLAAGTADDRLDGLARVAAEVNAPGTKGRLSYQQIADAVPEERGRSWGQWIVERGKKLA
ncbi:hypothetical protein [Streptomyces sp.]|uniref:hypothetical protein n=1 Tax=Streptomyces sp. TaxID=1931 RepID=UPI002F3F2E2F